MMSLTQHTFKEWLKSVLFDRAIGDSCTALLDAAERRPTNVVLNFNLDLVQTESSSCRSRQ